MAKSFVLDVCKQLGEKVSHHIIGTDESQIDGTIMDAFVDEMILHINVLHCSMVHWVLCEQVGCPVVNMQGGGLVNVLMEFQ